MVEKSPNEHRASDRVWPYTAVLDLVRKTAAEDLGVESEGESLLEILQDVYAQGGADALSGLRAIASVTGADMTAAVLGVDWPPDAVVVRLTDATSEEPAGGPHAPD